MLGAIIGDIVGSIYEFQNTKSMDFDLITPWSNFTDDSVMTLAVAKWSSHGDRCLGYDGCMAQAPVPTTTTTH